MGLPVVITDAALADLRLIAEYIGQNDPQTAIKFCDALVDRTLILSDFPEVGRVVPEFHNPAVRELIAKPYRIVYRISRPPARIEILRFWHAARNVPDISET